MKTLIITFLTFFSIISSAQNKRIITYYDNEKKQVKEIYHVLDTDSSVLDGLYKTFYQNGNVKTIGFYTKNQATDYWEYRYQNGNIKMEGIMNNFQPQGYWIYYYESGVKSQEGNMEKGKKNGYWRTYYEQGNLKSEGMYVNNKNEGEWKYYYEDGALKAKGNFKNGEGLYTEYYTDGKPKAVGKIKDGKGDSTWVYYYPNGSIKAIGKEKNGQKDGEWTYYYENGNQSSIGFYKEGETSGFWRYFYENGKVSSEGLEIKGQREGNWKMYYDNGKQKGEGTFKDGDGTYTEYYDNGKPKVKGYYKKGKHDGLWTYYYEDGTKEGECNYFNGEGWFVGYYKDGAKKMEGFLNNGNKTGVWKLYKQDGSIAGYYKTYYEDNDDKTDSTKKTVKKDSVAKKTISYSPKKKNKSIFYKLNKLYKPNPLVYKTFILSIEPINLALGNAPLNVEYYYERNWGIEASLIYYQRPLFRSKENQLERQSPFSQGFGYSIAYKKYIPQIDILGMAYLGSEFLQSNINYYARYFVSDFLNTVPKEAILFEQKNQISLLAGNRFMKFYDSPGVTFDMYVALGIGFRSFERNYSNKQYDSFFQNIFINLDEVYIPYRFGLSVGYAF
jgi:antitoxin component YwqK of YwqJK toxin-antitoxin module